MATAHKVMVTTTKKNRQQMVWNYSTADTNGTALLTPSGDSTVVFSNDDCYITDYVHSTQGTCTQVYVWFNGVRIYPIIYTANSQPTVNRQIKSSPIFVPGGTQVKFTTIT